MRFCHTEKLLPFKNSEKAETVGVHQQEYDSSLKNGLPPNFNNSFHLQKKNRSKTIDKTDKNLVSTFLISSS